MKIRHYLQISMLAASALVMTACSGSGDKSTADSDSMAADSLVADSAAAMAQDSIQAEAEAKAQEEAFSKEVTDYLTKVYTKQSSEGVFSPEFEELKGSAEMTSFKMGNEMGYFDYDVLTQSQDPGKLKGVEIVSVSEDSATANVKGSGFGESGKIKVTVVRVKGKLYIDDVNGEKARLKKFLGR